MLPSDLGSHPTYQAFKPNSATAAHKFAETVDFPIPPFPPVSTVQFTPEERQKKQVAVDLCSGVLKKMDKLYERSQIQDRSAPGVEMPFFNTLMDGITEGFQFRDFILKYMAWKKTDMDNGLAEERIARAAWLQKRAQEQSQS